MCAVLVFFSGTYSRPLGALLFTLGYVYVVSSYNNVGLSFFIAAY